VPDSIYEIPLIPGSATSPWMGYALITLKYRRRGEEGITRKRLLPPAGTTRLHTYHPSQSKSMGRR